MLVGKRFGPFTIEKELGSGAMGTVYRAIYHSDDGRETVVALKVVSLGLLSNEGALARFARESAILKQLRHPHIVRLFATGRHKTTPFIAMEYIDGEPLDRMLQRRGRLGWEDVVAYGKQLCEALQHAHEKGIIHRDLKPSNLMLTKDGVLKLTDFGIAKDEDVTALTSQNNTIGTAAYMSPEQCQGKLLSNKSDLYSLGVVFYELLTGKKPFVAETTMDLFLKHVNDKPIRPARLVPDLPVWLDNLVMFLMEKDRDQRPMDAATVGKMLADIEQKVQDGASVGESVAKARKIDRKLSDGPLDAADKTAATALRGKKKKKKGRPWHEKEWVRAVPLVVALLAVVGGAGWFLWPEGIEARFKRVEAAATPDAKLEAAGDFLASYKGTAGPQVDKARELFTDLAAREKEKGLLKRLGKERLETNPEGYDQDGYPDAIAALKAERAGDLDEAARRWAAVQSKASPEPARLPDPAEITRSCLAWIAVRHLADIRQGVPAAEAGVKDKLAKARTFETAYPADGTDGEAARGLLLEEYGDPARARTVWADLAKQHESDPDKRAWLFLAAQRAKRLADAKDDPDGRAKRLAERLQTVLKPFEADPSDGVAQRTVRNTARELALLYAADTSEAVQAVVKQAKRAADATKGAGG